MIEPMMMKIHSVGPASFKLIDFANTGEAIKLIKPAANPTFNPLIIFSIVVSPFFLKFNLDIALAMPVGNHFLRLRNNWIFKIMELNEVSFQRSNGQIKYAGLRGAIWDDYDKILKSKDESKQSQKYSSNAHR
jgi:hypothetical protein